MTFPSHCPLASKIRAVNGNDSLERGCIIMTFPSAFLPGQMFLDQMKPEELSSCKTIS